MCIRDRRKELEKLNQLAWQADEDTILGWADTEGYPVDGTVDADGQYSNCLLYTSSASSRMCSTRSFPPTSMWTSASCRPLRSGTIIPLSLIHIW